MQALPFDILKVDRSFMSAAAAGDRRAVATIAAVGALASRLGVDVVAEGVEDLAELPSLRSLGCGYAQGYAIAAPMPPADIGAAMPPADIGAALLRQGSDGWVLSGGRAAAVLAT